MGMVGDNLKDLGRILAHKNTREILLLFFDKYQVRRSEIGLELSETIRRAINELIGFGIIKDESIRDEPYKPVIYILTDRGKNIINFLKGL